MTDQALLARARQHHQRGELRQAELLYRSILEQDPNEADALHLLGVVAHQCGQYAPAIELIGRAIALRPRVAAFHLNVAEAYRCTGNLDRAAAHCQTALQLQPSSAQAHNNFALVLQARGRLAEAAQYLEQAIRHDARFALAHNNLGNLRQAQGRTDEALAAFQEAVRLEPTLALAHSNLGQVLLERGEAQQALKHCREAIRLQPQMCEAHNNLGNVFRDLRQVDDAERSYREAARLNPGLADVHNNLGDLEAERGRPELARQHYRQSYQCKPEPRLRLVAERVLPIIYDSLDHLNDCRATLAANLRRLDEEGFRLDPTRDVVPTLFYLAYQGHNDRDLHSTMARLGGARDRSLHRPVPRVPGGKVRAGFLSDYFKGHTIGRLNLGTIARLNRKDFEVTVLAIEGPQDDMARQIRQSGDRALVLSRRLPTALEAIAGLDLDILFYTDIGMSATTYTLAFSRLAPIQCVTWGHPVTTGLPTMDYFISSADLETDAGAEHYTEKLVRLPRLAVCFERPVPAPRLGRGHFGLPENAHLYVCPQSLFKFHPDFDELLAGILRADAQGLLVLREGDYPLWAERLRRRFARTMSDVQDRIRFMPQMSRNEFLNLFAVADVALDTIHFGGGNTSYEALAQGTPVVTLPSPFLRCRITYAMYRQMGLLDLVAQGPADFVRLAVRLGTDVAYREEMRRRILETCPVLFDDAAAINHLEDFFRTAVAGINK